MMYSTVITDEMKHMMYSTVITDEISWQNDTKFTIFSLERMGSIPASKRASFFSHAMGYFMYYFSS
jgi:hypothetical protein